MAADESQKQKRGDRRSKEQGQKNSFRVIDGSLSSQEFGVGASKYKSTKGRVVLRGDIVKDDSGSYAVFSEQGSSASQMTAAKIMDFYIKTSRMFRTSSRCSIRLHPGQNGRCTDLLENFKVRMSRYVDTSTKTHMA